MKSVQRIEEGFEILGLDSSEVQAYFKYLDKLRDLSNLKDRLELRLIISDTDNVSKTENDNAKLESDS